MGNPDPLKALEVHWAYLTIVGSRQNEAFAADACREIIVEIRRMQEDFGMSDEMAGHLIGILEDRGDGRPATARVREAAKVIGAVVAKVKEKETAR